MKEKRDMTDVDVECTAHATPLTPEPRNTAQELKVAVNTKRLSETIIDKLFRNDGSRLTCKDGQIQNLSRT